MFSKILPFLLLPSLAVAASCDALQITGVLAGVDAKIPHAIELYAATDLQLNDYCINFSDGASDPSACFLHLVQTQMTAGTYFTVTLQSEMKSVFYPFFEVNIPNGIIQAPSAGLANWNGQNSVLLFKKGTTAQLVDRFGSGTMNFVNQWYYRINGYGPNPTYTRNEWTTGTLVGVTVNSQATTPMPRESFSCTATGPTPPGPTPPGPTPPAPTGSTPTPPAPTPATAPTACKRPPSLFGPTECK